MMKFIDGNTDVHRKLNQWAQVDNKALLKASFYAWKPTSDAFGWKPEDHSCTELLIRSLLHQLLTSAPKYIQTVFSQHWNPEQFTVFNTKTRTEDSRPRLSFSELQTALHELLERHLTQSYRIFFLIDALDEFGHPHSHEQLAITVQSWCQCSPQNIKICVSSREDNPFLNTFPAQQRLQLHGHTTRDIEELVKTRLTSNSHFQSPNFEDQHREELVQAIVNNAEGVFVWVVFTVNELLLLLADRQDFVALKEVVDKFCAEELNDFFKQIFNRIPSEYRPEARAVFSVVGTVSASPMLTRYHFCLQHYAAISKCLTSSATWSQPNSCQNLSEQAAHDVRQFKSRLPTISRGLLELDYDTKESVTLVQENYAGLRFIHRSVYDFFKDNPGALVNTSHEESTIDSLALILRSSIRVLGVVTPLDTSDHRFIFWSIIQDSLWLVDNKGRNSRGDVKSHYLSSLRELDIAIFRTFGALPSNKSFESCAVSDLILRPAFPSVFQASICSGDSWYAKWALDGNYPSWIRSDSVKDYVFEMIFTDRDVESGPLSNDLRNAVHSGYLDLNEPPRCLPPLPDFSPQIKGSLWLHYSIQSLMSHGLDLSVWHTLILKFNPELRINFRWWSEGQTHQQDANDAPRGKNQQPWSARGEDIKGIDLGKQFGVIVTVGDDREGQLIQGPQWSNKIHDTRIIRLLIFNFGTESGEAALRDILEKMLRPNDNGGIGMEPSFPTPSPAERLEQQLQAKEIFQALDGSLVGKESAAKLATPNKELKEEGGNVDLALVGFQTEEKMAWECRAARSSQYARSSEGGWMGAECSHLPVILCGLLGKSIYNLAYAMSCDILLT